ERLAGERQLGQPFGSGRRGQCRARPRAELGGLDRLAENAFQGGRGALGSGLQGPARVDPSGHGRAEDVHDLGNGLLHLAPARRRRGRRGGGGATAAWARGSGTTRAGPSTPGTGGPGACGPAAGGPAAGRPAAGGPGTPIGAMASGTVAATATT